jgi:hypothetical protein
MVPTHFGHVRSWKVTNRKRATLTTGTRHLNIPNEVGLRQKAQRGRGEAFEVGHLSCKACQKEIWSHFHLLYPKSSLPHKNQLGLSHNLEQSRMVKKSSICCSSLFRSHIIYIYLYDLCIFGYPPFEASRYLSHYLKYITFFPYKMVTNGFISQFYHQHPTYKDTVSIRFTSGK